MDLDAGMANQINAEQRALDAMYARLDAEVSEMVSAHARAMAAPVDGSGDLFARDLEVARLAEKISQLRAAERSLCFGRIDGVHGESLYVGRIGLRTDTGDALLVDWRAAAALPFYSATMVSPLGLRRRRHLRVEDRVVVDVSDEILDGTAPTEVDVVGDGPLVSALSGARTGRMREAAGTLQREQDEIVRSPHRGIIVVDGGPGTGKTIVALHRAAYVLYSFPEIAGRGVLVFGPNRRFLTYISDVLPSLGENDVQLATMPDLLGVEATRTETDQLARIKGQAAFAEGLARWVQDRQPHGVPLELRTAHGTVVLDADTVDALRRDALESGIGHNRARELFTERVVDDMVNELERQAEKEVVDFEAEIKDVLGIDLDRMFPGHASPGSESGDHAAEGLDIDWDLIRDELVDDPGIDRIIDQVWPRLRAEDVVRGVLADRASLDDPDADGWTSADLALLDEARALVDGHPETSYGHIVVDEAQQITQMQWRMLMRRCTQRSMTVVGDLAQAGPTTTVHRWADALEPFVDERFAHHTLTVNYRTTAEILQATEPLLARIAPQQRLSRSIRHGDHPTIVGVDETDVASVLDELIIGTQVAHPGELIGVVTAAQRFAALGAGIDESDATIIAAPDARGLEFDTVVIVDPRGIQAANEAGLRDLYVAQTRATKRLITLEVAANLVRR